MRLTDLDGNARDLAEKSIGWMDPWWDPSSHLLWNPPGAFEEVLAQPRTAHMVRESAWYVVGLLLRAGPGDEERAIATTLALLDHQYDEPGTAWHGTWPRFPEEPRPSGDARMWIDFDPNWRQFVGTGLALATRLFPGAFPADVKSRVDTALRRAVAGEPPDRVPPNYSNIALMRSWLEGEVAARSGESGLAERAVGYAREVVDLFNRHGAFEEYNSPTYYGIDLYALGLWQSHASTPELASWGTEVHDAVWHDFVRFYHPTLRNVCGPYSRAYGMDMTTYVANMSMWIWAAVGREAAPFPGLGGELRHGHDFSKGPAIAVLAGSVPAGCEAALDAFGTPRLVRQRISDEPDRVATAWVGERTMIGGESNGAGWNAYGQYHPATVHWTDGTDLGWIRVVRRAPLHAAASELALSFDAAPHRRHGPQETRIVVSHPAVEEEALEQGQWHLPGLLVAVGTEAELVGRQTAPGRVDLTYAASESVQRFELGLGL